MVLLSSVVGLTAGCATTGARPDMTVSRIIATPAEATVNTRLLIQSSIRNAGGAPANAPASADIGIFADAGAAAPLAGLTAWAEPDGANLQPGATAEDEAGVNTPSLQPGAYSICAIADLDDRIAESDETNNRTCTPFSILAGPPRRADLVIEKVTPIGPDQASLKVKVKIRNAGTDPASAFRIMAFRRTPRLPLLLIECPLTEGQLSAGSPASCEDLILRAPIAPGASVELTGYFAYVVANGASFVRTPIGPGNPNPAIWRDVDFMVDGCFPPEDMSPVYCAIEEIDEINNFKGARLKVR